MSYLSDIIALFKYYRARIIFSLVGIAVGIGAICALIALNGIVKKNSQEFIEKFGGSRFVLNVMATTADKKLLKEQLNFDQVNKFIKPLSKDYQMVPYKLLSSKARFDLVDIEAVSLATSSDIFKIMQWEIAQGRKLHPLDEKDKVVVIGAKVVKKLGELGIQDVIGQVINIDGYYFSIVGTLQEKEFNPVLDFDVNDAVLLDLHFLSRFENDTAVDSFIVQGSKHELKTSEQILKERLIQKLGNVRFFFRDALMFEKALFKQVTLTMNMLTIVAAVTLFLGIISILNLLFILIDERKKEIGLRMSVGATSRDIGKQFLIETSCLSMIGGCGGIVLGQLIAYLIVLKLDITYYAQFFSWLVGVPISLLIGLSVGFIPARFAGKMDPVKLINS